MSDVGPQPKSNPRSFRYPMCSGIELMSSSERFEILPAWSLRFSLAAEASDAADVVELKRVDIGPGKEDVAFHARPPASGALLNLPYPPEGRTVNEDICKGSVNIHVQSLEFAERRFIQFIGRPTERLERGKAVNRCRAMAGIAPRPFKPDPPSIVYSDRCFEV